jgi:hypothetical protein
MNYRTLIRIIVLAAIPAIGLCEQADRADSSDVPYQLISLAQDIISGRNQQLTLSSIAPGSYVVSSSNMADLRAVVLGTDKSIQLTEDSTRQAIRVMLKSNPNEDAAYLVLTTATRQAKDFRCHTIVFMKDKTGKWFVETWHTPQ